MRNNNPTVLGTTRSNRISTLETKIAQFNNTISKEKTTCRIVPKEMFEAENAGAYTMMTSLDVVLPLVMTERNGREVVDAKSIWGCDYHELSHILFSMPPGRSGYSLQRFADVYTIAEENRVENLFVLAYPGSKDILGHGVGGAVAPVGKLQEAADRVAGKDVNTATYKEMAETVHLYFMVALRPWVSPEWKSVRQAAIDVWGYSNVELLDSLLMKYTSLPKKDLARKAPAILRKIQELLPEVKGSSATGGGNGSGTASGKGGNPKGRGSATSPSGDASCPSTGDSTGGGLPDNSGAAGDFDDTDIADQYGEQADDNGVAEDGSDDASGGVSGELGDDVEPTITDASLAADAGEATRELDGGRPEHHRHDRGGAGYDSGNLRVMTMPVIHSDYEDRRALARVFEEIEDDHAPTYRRGLQSGRVDIREVTKPNWDYSKMFMEFEPGKDDSVEIEAVYLTDVSGSMSGNEQDMARNVWVVGNAVKDAAEGSRNTWLAFDNDVYSVYTPENQFSPMQVEVPISRGGTTAAPGLRVVSNVFDESDLDQKFLIMLTDGSWWDHSEAVRVLEGIRRDHPDATLMLMGYGYDVSSDITDLFDVYITSDDMDDLRVVGQKIVKSMVMSGVQ